jgi:hypothetical protein
VIVIVHRERLDAMGRVTMGTNTALHLSGLLALVDASPPSPAAVRPRPNALLRHLDRSFSKHVRRRTFPSRYPIIPLARIWLSRQLTAERVWAHRSHASGTASDHLPLCLECRLQHDLEGVDRH